MKEIEGWEGKFCPIQHRLEVSEQGTLFKNKRCDQGCAWYCTGIKGCVLHSISINAAHLVERKRGK